MARLVAANPEATMKRAYPTRLLLVSTVLALASVAWGPPAPEACAADRRGRHHQDRQASRARPKAVAAKPSAFRSRAPRPLPRRPALGWHADFRDPETGEAGLPTTENVRQLASNGGKPAIDISNRPQTRLADGHGWMIDTRDVEDALVLQIDKNGNRVPKCVSNKDATQPRAAKGQERRAREDRQMRTPAF